MENTGRIVFLDWLRFIACFMVILVHSIEPFYLGGTDGTYIASFGDACWVTFINSALRSAVPLFVLASSYLLFPLKIDTGTFFRKRFVRVLIPYFVWVVLYAFLPALMSGSAVSADSLGAYFKGIIFNFPMQYGHLWFVFMLVGVYFLMPLLSPWAEKVSRKEERGYLILWAFTTLMPFISYFSAKVTGNPDLWGKCPWNAFGAFHTVSGYFGYLVLGHYLRKYSEGISWKKTLSVAIPFWIIGYAVTASGFWSVMPRELGFPLSMPYQTAVDMEISWDFCSFGVMMQTVAYFLVIKKITADGWFYDRIVLPISKISYGMYLMHMLFLPFVFTWVRSWGIATPFVMLLTAFITYSISAVVSRLISFLPKSKYIVG